MDDKHIKIWWFEDAPAEYQGLVKDLDDIDMVMFIPDGFDVPGRIDLILSAVGSMECQEFAVEGGRVFIGWHS